MYARTTLAFLLLWIHGVSAGQHRNNRNQHRQMIRRTAQGCEEGSWQCDGSQLQQYVSNEWMTIQDCTGQDMVCSVAPETTGCVWTWDVSSVAIAASASPTSSIAYAETPSQSVIGGGLVAGSRPGPSWYTQSTNDWDAASTTDWSIPSAPAESESASPTASSTQWNGQAPSPSVSPWSASVTTSNTDDWSAPSTTDSADLDSASVSGSATASDDWNPSTATASTTRGGHGSQTSSASAATPTSGGGSSGTWSAPHHVVYSDLWLHTMPEASQLADFNRFILAFWMSNRGAVDNAQMWEWMSASDRQDILDEYHAAGIALMVSAFGSTDSPVSDGVDPTDCARRLAAWVKQYKLDGVDIDWEDMQSMNTGNGEAWLITFQQELRRQLPSGQYLISHAPVAPWFTSGADYPNGAYVAVHKQAGDGIDFYNMQFYNQGDIYMDCKTLIFNSGSGWPSTSVMEMNSYAGVPLDKIVIGKPINAGAANNGYMDASSLATCIKQAQANGWNGGVMYWEWNSVSIDHVAEGEGLTR